VTCQIGTASAVRTDHAAALCRRVQQPFLPGGIGFSLTFAALLVYLPALNAFFGTAPLARPSSPRWRPSRSIVWGADELRRLLTRRHR
jgi:hypothetical protein